MNLAIVVLPKAVRFTRYWLMFKKLTEVVKE